MSTRAVQEELRRQLLDSVEGLAVESVQVQEIHCSFQRSSNRATLHARYELTGAVETESSLLVLESIGRYHPSTVVSAVNGSVTWGPHDQQGGRDTPAIALIEPNPGFSWSQVELSVECEATREAVGSGVMLLPEYLPLPLSLSKPREAIPLIQLRFDRSIAPMIGGGIPYDPALSWDPRLGAACQAALLLEGSPQVRVNEELETRVGKLVRALTSYLGRSIDPGLLVISKTQEEPTRRAGFILDEERFGSIEDEIADYAPLLEHVVGMWWGGGCRIAGPQGEKIESTLRLAVMMHLACRSATSSDDRDEMLRDFEQNPGLALAAGLCRHLGAGSLDRLGPMRRLTSSSWGHCIPERTVFEALAPALNSLR